MVYREGNAVAHAIQRWKYDRDEVVGRALAAVLRQSFAPEAARDRCIVPVPAHPRRLRQRGFNPALTLARALARSWTQVRPDLLRRRAGSSQVGAGRRAREANALDAFAVARGARIAGRAVLIVDDVFTTGATARGCAAALLDGGAAAVDVITLAHTAPPDPFRARLEAPALAGGPIRG